MPASAHSNVKEESACLEAISEIRRHTPQFVLKLKANTVGNHVGSSSLVMAEGSLLVPLI